MRELLRVVTVLEVSSASSSSFSSRTLLKNLKMEVKLIQEVSSCLSVPTCRRYTQTHTHTERYLVTVVLQAKAVHDDCANIMINLGNISKW